MNDDEDQMYSSFIGLTQSTTNYAMYHLANEVHVDIYMDIKKNIYEISALIAFLYSLAIRKDKDQYFMCLNDFHILSKKILDNCETIFNRNIKEEKPNEK